MTSKRRPNQTTAQPEKPYLPDPSKVVEIIKVRSPEVGDFTIHRTNELDPYEEPAAAVKPGKGSRPRRRR